MYLNLFNALKIFPFNLKSVVKILSLIKSTRDRDLLLYRPTIAGKWKIDSRYKALFLFLYGNTMVRDF